MYSSGVVLYEMLTGRLPFEGDSAVSVAIQHLSSIPLAPREINPDIPEQLELICLKAMASDLEKRYPSADAMIADLETFRKNPGVSLDFEIKDLRSDEVDEPTQSLHAGSHVALEVEQNRRMADHREDRSRSQDDRYAYEDDRPASRKRTVLLVAGIVAAVVLAAALFKGIFASFTSPESVEYATPEVLGLTVEAARSLDTVDGIFTIKETGAKFSQEPAGIIIEQTPDEGTPCVAAIGPRRARSTPT